MRPGTAVIALWFCFAVSWIVTAMWSNTVDKRVGIKTELPYRVTLIVGGLVLAVPAHNYVGPLRLWFVTRSEAWVCIALIACGFAFSWWARIHLGALWSSGVTKKTDHRVIDTGPYGIVRHPIYTGILFAVYATAAVKGTVAGLVGAAIITLGLWMKARLEEGWLANELEAGAYERYGQRVPMLFPFGPKRKISNSR